MTRHRMLREDCFDLWGDHAEISFDFEFISHMLETRVSKGLLGT